MATFQCKRCGIYGLALSVEGNLIMEPERCPACGADGPLDLEKKDPLSGTPVWDYNHLHQRWVPPTSEKPG